MNHENLMKAMRDNAVKNLEDRVLELDTVDQALVVLLGVYAQDRSIGNKDLGLLTRRLLERATELRGY